MEDFYQKVIGLVEETDEPDSSEEKSRKISVVIPCYNAERTIDACLTSLVHQTVPLEQIELILVITDQRTILLRNFPNGKGSIVTPSW